MNNKLLTIRTALNCSVKEFAGLLSIDPSIYVEIENNYIPASIEQCEIVAKRYHVPTAFLIGKSYKLQTPYNNWKDDQKEDYKNARNSSEREFLTIMYGNPIFED